MAQKRRGAKRAGAFRSGFCFCRFAVILSLGGIREPSHMPARPASLLTTIARLPRRFGDAAMLRIVLVWALVLAAGAFVLQWLQYQYVARVFSPQIYIVLIGTAFAVGGVWVGWRLSARPAPAAFARNEAARKSLGLTGQEMKVLELLAGG